MTTTKNPGATDPAGQPGAADEQISDEELAKVSGGLRRNFSGGGKSSTYDPEKAEETNTDGSDIDY